MDKYTIKPLEWESEHSTHCADGIGGSYIIDKREDGIFRFIATGPHWTMIDVKLCSLEEAKKKASAHHVERLIRRLSPANDGWQPIETAPKDGRIIDLWTRDNERIANAYWYKTDSAWKEQRGHRQWYDTTPTHWMPLPEPPTREN